MTMQGFVTGRNAMDLAVLQGLKVPATKRVTDHNGANEHIQQYPYMEGDSYPPTTSGNITEDEDTAHGGHFSRPVEQQQAQFSYMQRPPQVQQSAQHQPVQSRPKQTVPVSRRSEIPRHQEQPRTKNQPLDNTNATRHRAIPVVPAMPVSEPHQNVLTDADELDFMPEDYHDDPGDMHEDTLDHDPNLLYTLPYETLKAESFDVDPRNSNTVKGSLIKRLRADTSPEVFTNASTADWEEAGKWIIAEITDATDALVNVRKDMRQVLLSYEAELEKHYSQIKAKHEKVDLAMNAMRKQGLAMLAIQQ